MPIISIRNSVSTGVNKPLKWGQVQALPDFLCVGFSDVK